MPIFVREVQSLQKEGAVTPPSEAWPRPAVGADGTGGLKRTRLALEGGRSEACKRLAAWLRSTSA